MGRRSLPKTPQGADYASHLLDAELMPTTFDPLQYFPASNAFEIEVGTGKGLFLRQAARANPERQYLGIEIAGKYARYVASHLSALKLDNARMIHGNAERFFKERLSDAWVTAVHVYFPDPWWKARHRKRRVMNESFLNDVVRVLKPGGALHFWTDVKEYFDSALELIAKKIELDGPLSVPETPAEHDMDFRTHFERRTRMSEAPVYRSEFRKPC